MRRFYFPLLLCLAGFAADGARASISYDRVEIGGSRLLVVKGEFEASDDPAKLVSEIKEYRPTFITFDSPGGSVSTAIAFGRAIRAIRADTIQPRAALCASACSLAFVGGVHRLAEPGSIGVHQSSFTDDVARDSKTAVAAIQAVTAEIIGYLVEMGVSPKLLQISLAVESNDMRYLTMAEMSDLNVTTPQATAGVPPSSAPVEPPPPSRPASIPPNTTPVPPPNADVATSSAAQEALRFMTRYNDAWSTENTSAMAFMRGAYADQVSFYGKIVERHEVLRNKAAFAERWPERTYAIRPGTERVACSDKCTVSGTVEWFARSLARGKTSSGAAEFTLVWNPVTKRIESETGKVLANKKGATSSNRIPAQ